LGLGGKLIREPRLVTAQDIWALLVMDGSTPILTWSALHLASLVANRGAGGTHDQHTCYLLATVVVVKTLRLLRAAAARAQQPSWVRAWARCAVPGFFAAATEPSGQAAEQLSSRILPPPEGAPSRLALHNLWGTVSLRPPSRTPTTTTRPALSALASSAGLEASPVWPAWVWCAALCLLAAALLG
jgi:hypothetical protein